MVRIYVNPTKEAAQQGSADAIATLLNSALKSHSAVAKVGLRQQDHLLYITLESDHPLTPHDFVGLVQTTLSKMELPWLKLAKVSGRHPGQLEPLWQQELLFHAPPPIAQTLPSAPELAQTLREGVLNIHIGDNFSGQLLVGNNNRQSMYHYTVHGDHGGVLNPAAPPQIQARALPVNLRPPTFTSLLNRKAEISTITTALQSALPVEMYAEEGMGKTAILRYLAYDAQATAPFSSGIVYLSAHRQTAEDLLQSLYDAFYESSVPHKPSYSQVQHALQGQQALIVLDDLQLEKADLEWLIAVVPHSVVLLVSPTQLYWRSGASVALKGLALEDAIALIERELERPLTPAEHPSVRTLWETLQGHPLSLQRAAAQVRESQADWAALIPISTANASPTTALFHHWAGLLPRSRQGLLALLGALGGLAITAEQAAAMTAMPNAGALLEELRTLHFVQLQDRLYHLSYDLVSLCQQSWTPDPWLERAVTYFTTHTTAATPSTPDILLRLLEWTQQAGRWGDSIALARLLDAPLALSGRWQQWQQVLDHSLRAAQALGDPAAEAWAWHQLGTRALGLEDVPTAEQALTQALRLRESLQDYAGASVTRHNLSLITPPLVSVEEITPIDPLAEGSYIHWPGVGTLLASVGILGILVGTGIWVHRMTQANLGLALSSDQLDFGPRALQSLSEPQRVTITNQSQKNLQIQQIELTGNPDFQLAAEDCIENDNSVLDPTETCDLDVRFQPTALNDRTGTVTITTSDGKTYTLALKGSGSEQPPPRIAFNPDIVNFETIEAQTAKAIWVTLTNDGTVPITITNLTFEGGQAEAFTITNQSCSPASIPPQETCSVQVQFAPTEAGEYATRLFVDSANASLPALVLSGVATAPRRPTAENDTATLVSVEGTSSSSVTIPVLANDTNPTAGALTVVNVTQGQLGSTQINPDNTVTYTYTPEPSRSDAPPTPAQDSFQYTIRSVNGQEATATVNVTIEYEAPPFTAVDDTFTVVRKGVLDVLANDQGIGLKIVSINDIKGVVGYQVVVTINEDGSRVLYENSSGVGEMAITFSYTVQNSQGETATATATIYDTGPSGN